MKITILTIITILLTPVFIQDSNTEIIEQIRKEFKRINNDAELTKQEIVFYDESTDGANMIVFRDKGNAIKKVSVIYYGESGKLAKEFYLKNDKLIFAFFQSYDYNRPYYWNEKEAEEFGDSEFFDSSKTEVSENRYYFNSDSRLFRWINENNETIGKGIDLVDKQREI